MQHLNTFNTFVINLERRKDRFEFVNEQMEELGVPFTTWTGWDAKYYGEAQTNQELKLMYDKPFYSWSKKQKVIEGRKGCLLSHVKLHLYALNQKYNNILVFEDDVILSSSVIPKVPDDAAVCFLGGKIDGELPSEKEGDSPWVLIKDFKVWEMHAYLVIGNHNLWRMHKYLTEPNLCPRVIDGMVTTRIQKKLPCYVLREPIAVQNREFKSDVTFIIDEDQPTNST